MGMFKTALTKQLAKSQSNNFGIENFDEYRFGKMNVEPSVPNGFFYSLKQLIKVIIGYNRKQKKRALDEIIERATIVLEKYEQGLEFLYNNIHPDSRQLIVNLVAYKILGYSKVKLPFNNPQYWKSIETAKKLKEGNDTYDPHFLHFILDKFNLNPIGYDIKIFFSEVGIAIDFIAEQYAYKLEGKTTVQVKKGDVVLDLGGCWADTALYFAYKIGAGGKVYSFEFIPDNIKLHNVNTDLNPVLKQRITVVPNPVSSVSGQKIYFKDHGPGSKVEFQPFKEQTGSAETISIDDFVRRNVIKQIDFIKMDIEGAELLALQGAIETIRMFKPILAIAIYHSMEDFINIPKWIVDLNLDYELFIGHYTIHAEETICFAKPKSK